MLLGRKLTYNMNRINSLFLWLTSRSSESVHKFGAQYDAFSLFVFLFFLANPLKWHFSGPYSFSIIAFLRILAIIIWAILALWRRWPKRLKKYLPLYWHFALFYHLPFRTTFSVLYSTYSPLFDSFELLGIVALAVLVDDKAFCILTSLGIFLGCMVYFVFGGFYIPLTKVSTLAYAGSIVVAITYMKLIFFRNHYLSLDEKSKTYKILAGAIAHEVRGPICTIGIACENLGQNVSEPEKEKLSFVKQQTSKALSVIDSILLQVKYIEDSGQINRNKHSLRECVYLAINDPYFSDKDRALIEVNMEDDFVVLVDKLVLVQIFTNLIKNSLWAIRASGDGEIIMGAKRLGDKISISIYDNGVGISKRNLKKLFEPFFTRSEIGAGLGLAFSKLALKNMNGSIKCESKEGQFTRFTILLPGIFNQPQLALRQIPAPSGSSGQARG